MQNISLRSSVRKQNFEFGGLKVTQQSWLLLFAFSPPLFFRFSCLIFFSFAVYLVGFILVGKVKGRRVLQLDFHGNFQVNVTWFFAFLSSALDWIELILVCFKDLFTLHNQVSGQSCPWLLKLMTPQAVEGLWIRTGGYGWLRGEWVNTGRPRPEVQHPYLPFLTGRVHLSINLGFWETAHLPLP